MLDDMRERREEQRSSSGGASKKSKSKGGGGGRRVESAEAKEARLERNRKSCWIFLFCACLMCGILAGIIALVFVFVVNAE